MDNKPDFPTWSVMLLFIVALGFGGIIYELYPVYTLATNATNAVQMLGGQTHCIGCLGG